MIAQYVLSYLKNSIARRDDRSKLLPIITIIFASISSVICEGFLAYFVFIAFQDNYGFSTAFSAIFTVVVFYFQAILLFTCSYYLYQKSNQSNPVSEEYKKITNAFMEGFQKKS